jgi:hypothetical protein
MPTTRVEAVIKAVLVITAANPNGAINNRVRVIAPFTPATTQLRTNAPRMDNDIRADFK